MNIDTAAEIMQFIVENGRIEYGTLHELQVEFEFEASERGWNRQEIEDAMAHPDFPYYAIEEEEEEEEQMTMEEKGTPWAEVYRGSGRYTGHVAAEPVYMGNGDIAPGWVYVGRMTEEEFWADTEADIIGRQE